MGAIIISQANWSLGEMALGEMALGEMAMHRPGVQP
jgi:hypothetical protein